MRSAPLALAALALTGCVIGSNKQPRPRDLPDSWLVDRVRILAIRADPPEARPGELVTFRGLVADPHDEIDAVVYAACAPSEASGFGCPVDFSVFDGEDPTPEQLAEAGVIGIEPFLPPTYVPDPALLDGLSGTALTEGVEITVMSLAMPLDLATNDTGLDFDEIEAAYKRLVVSEAATPNHNPEIALFVVDGIPIPPESVVEVDAGQAYDLGIRLDETTVETYVYTNDEGVTEERVEEPYANWYTTKGTMNEPNTLYPFLDATWTAPDRGEGTWYAVVRDRRGGMTWVTQAFRVRR